MDPVLFGIAVFHMLCGLLGIAGVIANVYYMSRPSQHGHYQHLILRTYAVSFCATIVAIELDWRFIMKRIKLLDLWIFRGLFYVYAGLQTTGEIRSFTDLSEISRPEGVVGIALLFHRTLAHQMYMDEIFHIVQTQKYCDNRWAEW